MAEPWTLAFGRYLRTLRERKGLSLQDVCVLSQAFAETVNKGYLSRCENGKQRIALSKVAPLSRIYGVSGDVLLEHIDLDMELDRIQGPDTAGMTFAELRDAGKAAFQRGDRWTAYATFRDAIPTCAPSLLPDYRDLQEQKACAHLSLGTAALGLGRNRLALHEYDWVEKTGHLGPRYVPLILERLAVAYRSIGDSSRARGYADEAIAKATEGEGRSYLGYAHSARAVQAYDDSDLDLAAMHFQEAYNVFKSDGLQLACSKVLANLGQVYFDLGRYGAARRALVATDRLAEPISQQRTRALTRILLGEIDALENKPAMAEERWKEAVAIAKTLHDKTLRFKAEYQLLRLAHRNDNKPVVRAIHRRLARLSQYVPQDTPELQGFREFSSSLALPQ